MDPEAEAPFYYARRFMELFVPKYLRGVREHGTILTSRDCLTHAEEEVLDLWAYLQATRHQMGDMETKLMELRGEIQFTDEGKADLKRLSKLRQHQLVDDLLNIVRFGNKEGKPEGLPYTNKEEKESENE